MHKEDSAPEDPVYKDDSTKIDNKLASQGWWQYDLSNKLLALIEALKNKPVILVACISTIMILVFYYSSEHKPVASETLLEERISRTSISGVATAVDPRAKWTEELLNEVKTMQSNLEKLIESKSVETKTQIDNFNQQLELMGKQLQDSFAVEEENNNSTNSSPVSLQDLSDVAEELALKTAMLPKKRQFGHVQRAAASIKKDTKDYITTGSFARATLLTGVVVGTGVNSAAAPEPIILRLADHAIFSKGYKTEQIKEAILIGSCSGDISSERAKCRLETVSLVNSDGDIIEKHVEGWLVGEDGRPGIRGVVVDKSSDIARMAILNGILGGIAQFLQNQATSGIFPISPITGPQHALNAQNSLKGGLYGGIGHALEKLIDFGVKRMDSMSPVVVIASGREVDVVFRKGFDLKQQEVGENIRLSSPTTTDYSQDTVTNYQHNNTSFNKVKTFSKASSKLKERFLKANAEEEYESENNSPSNLHDLSWHDQLEQPLQEQGNF